MAAVIQEPWAFAAFGNGNSFMCRLVKVPDWAWNIPSLGWSGGSDDSRA